MLPRYRLPAIALVALLQALPPLAFSRPAVGQDLDAAAADAAAQSIFDLCGEVWTKSDGPALDEHLKLVAEIVQRQVVRLRDKLIDQEAEHELIVKAELPALRKDWGESLAEAIFQAQIAGESGTLESVLRGGSAMTAAAEALSLDEQIARLEARADDLAGEIAVNRRRLGILPVIGAAVQSCGEEQRAWIQQRDRPATAVRSGTLVGQTGGRCTDAGGTLGFFIGLIFEVDADGRIEAWLAMNPKQRLEPSFVGHVTAEGHYEVAGDLPFSPYDPEDVSQIAFEGQALPESAEGIVVAEGTTTWVSGIAECSGTWSLIPIEKS